MILSWAHEHRPKPINCYVSPAGNHKIAQWYEALTVEERADTDEFIKDMRRTEEWKMPNYRPQLSGYRGIGELRWPAGKKEHRLIGYLKLGAFFALIGCMHKGRVYSPADALDTAKRRKKEIEDGKVSTVPYDL